MAVASFGPDARDAAIFDDEIGDFTLHVEAKFRIGFGFFSDEIQEIPLRHQADEFAVHRKMGEIRDGDGEIVDGGAKRAEFLMRDAQKIVKEAELVHQLEGGRVDGVAAKIAEEVGMFFENDDLDPGACEQEAQHNAGGATSCDAAGGLW